MRGEIVKADIPNMSAKAVFKQDLDERISDGSSRDRVWRDRDNEYLEGCNKKRPKHHS